MDPQENHRSIPNRGGGPPRRPQASPGIDDNKRDYFAALAYAAPEMFLPVVINEANHTAQGILWGADQAYNKATLSHDNSDALTGISLQFKGLGPLSASQLLSLMAAQSLTRVARLDYDPEDHVVRLLARSLCPGNINPSVVMNVLLADVRRVLADNHFQNIIGDCQKG